MCGGQTKRDLIIVLFFIGLLNFPFLNKAFHNDDKYYLDLAVQLSKKPLEPHLENYKYLGRSFESTFRVTRLLGSYYLAGINEIFGMDAERITHASFLVFTITAVISFYFLASFFTESPLFCALLLFFTPAFMVSSHSVMSDIPSLACMLLSLVCFIKSVKHPQLSRLSGLLFALGLISRATNVFQIAIMFLYVIIFKRGWKSFRNVTIIGLSMFGIWSAFLVYYFYLTGGDLQHAAKENLHFFSGNYHELIWSQGFIHKIAYNMVANLSFLGGATIFLIPMLIFLIKNKVDFFSYLVIIGLSVLVCNVYAQSYTIVQKLFLIFCISGGIIYFKSMVITLIRSLSKRCKSPEDAFLSAWFIAGIISITIFYPFSCVRYLLIALPPFIIWIGKGLEKFNENPNKAGSLRMILLVTTCFVGLLVAISDYQYASAYRNFAKEMKKGVEKNEKIWFVGDLGIRYYMEKMGFNYYMIGSNEPKRGDLVVVPYMGGWNISGELAKYVSKINEIESKGFFPVRNNNLDAKTGFYHHGTGLLPWFYSNAALDKFSIYKVIKPTMFMKELLYGAIEKDRVVIDFGEKYSRSNLLSGWSINEKGPGFSFIWSDNLNSQLSLPVGKLTDKEMLFRVHPFTYPGASPQIVNIFINGKLLKDLSLTSPGWNNYSVSIPKDYLVLGENIINFSFSRADKPMDLNLSIDSRSLSAAFDYIVFGEPPLEIKPSEIEDDNVGICRFRINEDERIVLYAHSPAIISLDNVLIKENDLLQYGIGMDELAWTGGGDGMDFQIYLSADGRKEKVYSRYLNPQSNSEDRKWFDESLDLNKYSGNRVTITFAVNAGKKADSKNDFGGWSDIEIVTKQ